MADFFLAFWDKIYQGIIAYDRWKLLLDGLGLTLQISICAIAIGTVLGIILAFFKISNSKLLRGISKVYIDVIRGTPVMTQLLIIYFIVFAQIPGMDRRIAAIIAFGMNSGAYVAEIIRGGILSVDKGQMEAGRSLGLGKWQTMFLIILPQAIKNAIPTYANEFIVLIKETAIVGYIGIEDLTKVADIVRSKTFEPFVPLLTAAAMYLVVTTILSKIFAALERRLRESDNR